MFSSKVESLKAQDAPGKYPWLWTSQGGGFYTISYDANISRLLRSCVASVGKSKEIRELCPLDLW